MPFAILLLDSNYLSSVRHAPKKWNVNYITVAGLSEQEQKEWEQEYGTDWSSVDSELHKELLVVTSMLNKLEQFGYHLVSSLVSTPRIAHKENENNRECYVWTLHKSVKNTETAALDETQQSFSDSHVARRFSLFQRQRHPKLVPVSDTVELPEPVHPDYESTTIVKVSVNLTDHMEDSVI